LSEFMWTTLAFAAAASMILGWVFVMSGREDE
jgi:hypothetical protein